MAAAKSVTTHEDIPLFAMYHSTNSSTITGPAKKKNVGKNEWNVWSFLVRVSSEKRLNLLQPGVAYLHPLKTSEKLKVF